MMGKLLEAERILRPLLVPSRIFGIYCDQTKYSRGLHALYGTLITLLVIVTCFFQGYYTYITGLTSSASFKLLIMMEFIRGAVSIVWNVFFFPKRMTIFLKHWCDSTTYNNLNDVLSSSFKRFMICTVIFLTMVITYGEGANVYTCFSDEEICVLSFGTNYDVTWPRFFLLLLYSVFAFYHAFVIPLAYVICGYIIRKEFGNIKSRIVSLIQEKQIIDSDDVLQCRQEHEAICTLLGVADDCFLPYSLFVCVYGVLYLCLSAYSALYEPDIIAYVPFLMISCSMALLTFVITGVTAGTVHASVYQHLRPLLELKTRQLKNEACTEVMLFITKLTSTDIGFTIMKIFVLSKTAVFTIFGTMVTYVIVAVQMKPGESIITCANQSTTL